MHSTIRQRLLQVEDLLDAMAGNESKMEALAETWTSSYSDIQAALDAQLLDEDTKQLAHVTASRVQIISKGFLELRLQADAMASALTESLEAIFSTLAISKDTQDMTPHPLSSTPDPSPQSTAPYMITAYEWLIRNLHNPYPPKHVKETLARETESTVKDLDNWFIDARRRIGWNQLRRRRFSNKRQEIVRAATKFFTGIGCPESLDPDTEMEFAAIEMSAFQLYSNKIVSRPELPQRASNGSGRLSPSNCRSHAFRDEPDNDVLGPRTNHPTTNNSRKRHFNHYAEPEVASPLKSRKQLKLSHGSRCQQSGTTSPGIATSTRQSVKRKRGLSQSEEHPSSAKRLCNASGLQAHASSEPLFCNVSLDTSAFDAWFKTSWEMAQPFDIAFNDGNQDNLRLELFNPSQSICSVADILPQTNDFIQSGTASKTCNSYTELNALPELDTSSAASTSSSPSSQSNVIPTTSIISDLDRPTNSSDVNTVMQNLSWLLDVDVTDHLLPPLWEEVPSMCIFKDPNMLFNFDSATCGEFPQVDLGLASTICS